MAMEAATLGVLLTMEDQASPKLRQFSANVQTASNQVSSGMADIKTQSEGMGNLMEQNRTALANLQTGFQQLGLTMMLAGVTLKNTNNEMAQGTGQMMLMVGGVITTIGMLGRFVQSIAYITAALKTLNATMFITRLLQGPAGWAMLAGGVAVASVAGYAMYSRREKSANTTNITNNIQGSVVTERQISETVRKEIIKTQQRNNTSGIQ